jgi:hypothetical protein
LSLSAGVVQEQVDNQINGLAGGKTEEDTRITLSLLMLVLIEISFQPLVQNSLTKEIAF